MANQFIAPDPILPAGRNARPPTLPIVYVRQVDENAQRELLVGKATDYNHVRYLDSTQEIYFLPTGVIGEFPEAFSFRIDQAGLLNVALADPSVEDALRPDDRNDQILLEASIFESRLGDYGISGAAGAQGSPSAFSVRQILLEEARLVLINLFRRELLHAQTPLLSRITFTNAERAAAAEVSANLGAEALTNFFIPRNAAGYLHPIDFQDVGDYPRTTTNNRGGASSQTIPPFDAFDIRRIFWFANIARSRLVAARFTDDATKQYLPTELSEADVVTRFTKDWEKATVVQTLAGPVVTNTDTGEIEFEEQVQTFPILGSVSPTQDQTVYFLISYNTLPAEIRYESSSYVFRHKMFTPLEADAFKMQLANAPTRRFRFRWGTEFALREPFDIATETFRGVLNVEFVLGTASGSFSKRQFPVPPQEGDLLWGFTVADEYLPELIAPPIAVLPTLPPVRNIGVSDFFENNRLHRFPFSGDLWSDLARGSVIFQAQTGSPPSGTEGTGG